MQSLLYYGGNLRINYDKKLNINLLYRNNYSPDQFFEQRTFVDASLIYESKHHLFSFNGGKVFLPNVSDSFQNTLFFSVKYILKLNLPVVKNKRLGNIAGQIIEMNKGIGKEGMLIQLGEKKFLTDKTGKFYFKDLVPDQYILRVTSNKLGVIATTNFPLQVNVIADSTHKINVPFTKTGGVVGKINFENVANVRPVIDRDKTPVVLVSLYNDKENYTTQMNNKNEFSFKEMKPASWKVKVYILGNQQLYKIQNPEQAIEIESDQLKEVNFNIQPFERKIYFSNHTYNVSLNK